MRPLRVDVQAALYASIGLVSLLVVCSTLYDPRLLAVRSYLAPYKDAFLAQVTIEPSSHSSSNIVLCQCHALMFLMASACKCHLMLGAEGQYKCQCISIPSSVGCERLDLQRCGLVDDKSGLILSQVKAIKTMTLAKYKHVRRTDAKAKGFDGIKSKQADVLADMNKLKYAVMQSKRP